MSSRSAVIVFALALVACDPNVVDAVREPEPVVVPIPASPLKSALIHRYSFEGTGTVVEDTKGAAHGEVIGTVLPGSGALPLNTGELTGEQVGEYVDLPNGIIHGLTDATFEAWVTWTNGNFPWQRIFDFGASTSNEEDVPGENGWSYLFLTASSGPDVNNLPNALRVSYSQMAVKNEDICQGPGPLPVAVPTHVAVVIDQAAEKMRLYQGGVRLSECDLKRPLSAINDINNWLGRSNYIGDHYFDGIFDEFRIYNAALTDDEIADSKKAGPNAGLEDQP